MPALLIVVPFVFSAESSCCAQDAQATVDVITVKSEKFQRSIELPATLRGYQTVDLYAKVGGYLESIAVDIGDQVTKGQVLAKLDIPEMESELAQRESLVAQAKAEYLQAEASVAESRARYASQQAAVEEAKTMLVEKQALSQYEESEYSRIEQLVSGGAVNSELLDAARLKRDAAAAVIGATEAKIRTAEAELGAKQAAIQKSEADVAAAQSRIHVAEANRKYTEAMHQYAQIQAPFDGVITKRWFDQGAFIQSADGNSAAKPIVQVVRIDKIRVSIKVSTSQISSMNKGDAVIIHNIDGLENQKFSGNISRMSAGVDESSRMMEIEVDLDNAHRRLMPGLFGYAIINVCQLDSAIVVPSSAITGDDGGQILIASGNNAKVKPVEVAFNDGVVAAITAGLADNERVVRNAAGIQDGQSITIRR